MNYYLHGTWSTDRRRTKKLYYSSKGGKGRLVLQILYILPQLEACISNKLNIFRKIIIKQNRLRVCLVCIYALYVF